MNLKDVPSIDMLIELSKRGGHPAALAEAALLCAKKSQDYNGACDIHKVDRSSYFPFGVVSYAQMISTKALRFNALTRRELNGLPVNFEGLRDTALDLINYCGFYIASQEGKDETMA